MALTINVSKISVMKQMEKLFNITLNLQCLDGLVEVINQNVSIRYRPGQNSISEKIIEVQNKMQKIIDDYKSEQQIFVHPQLDNTIIDLKTNLIG